MGLKKYLNKIKPHLEEDGKLHTFWSAYDGFESFLYIPSTTAKTGAHIHGIIDSKRIMSLVVVALLPALLFGTYNIGYQDFATAGELANASPQEMFFYGLLIILPKTFVSYVVGLGIKFAWAQWKKEEIQEGYLVTNILMPLIIPITCPLWVLALSIAFAVIFCKEIFDGTGMNIFNVALSARAFLFFSYPEQMTGDSVWVANHQTFDLGNTLPDAATMATPLGELALRVDIPYSTCDMLIGLVLGPVGETGVTAVAIGALLLLVTGVASWKTMLSVFVSGDLMATLFSAFGMTSIAWYEHLILGEFCFGVVFMATNPVTSTCTEKGKYIYGALIGMITIIIRVMNPGYPESMMLSALFANMLTPLIDYCAVQGNINRGMKRLTAHNK